jgi:peptide-methionine (S)-S-oxide reductase
MKKILPVGILFVLVMAVCALARAAPPIPVSGKTESIVVAGGCFWGVEAVFRHTKGVVSAVSGYAGGSAETAHYNRVGGGDTGHAESVQITYDPKQVTLDQLLNVYFKVAHDPTELNHQGPDYGTQYRSTVFTANADQEKIVKAKIAALTDAKEYNQPIVTTLEPLKAFYPAEDYHQNYLALNLGNPYIITHDLPKLAKLRVMFADLYK